MARHVVVVAALALLLGSFVVLADAPRTGVVTGKVVGSDGAPVSGATVQLVTEQGTTTMVSGENGEFRFVFVAPGSYTVRADMAGLQPAEGEIMVSAGGRADLELRLSELMGEEIVVSGEAPLVNKYDVTAGGTLTTREMTQIPAPARLYLSSVSFFPGVTNDAQSQGGWGYNPEVEGNSGGRNSFFLDGVDVTFARQGGGTRLLVASFATQEVKLEATGADAQYGRMVGGAVSTVLRSGTNQFHGEAVWYARNLEWDENYKVTPVLMPDNREDSYEISLAGPIVKDKLWFFVGDMERNAPVASILPDGSFFDQSSKAESTFAKVDFRPSPSHSLSATYLDAPFSSASANQNGADLASTWVNEWGGDLLSLGWDWAISDNLFLETRVATQNTVTSRTAPFESVDPSADPWRPAGNNYQYQDQLTLLFWNGCANAEVGDVEFPRDQFNASLNRFFGAHDIKVGVDYQAVEWRSNADARPRVIGRGYNPDRPGGFVQPGYINFYYGTPEGEWSVNPTRNAALFARDRMTFDRWTFNLGLRYEKQKHENDSGDVTVDDSAMYPRLNAVYDVKGDARMLLSATAGRYMFQLSQNWSANFNTTPTGRASFDRYRWNPATQAYDIFLTSVPPPQPGEVPKVDTTYKDELTVGFDWEFRPDWAFKAKLVYWEMNDMPQIYNQVDDAGNILRVVEKNPYATSERRAINLSVDRRFKNNWMVGVGYTYSSTKGTCAVDEGDSTGCVPAVGTFIDVVDPETGQPLSLINADGRLVTDRPRVFKLRGMYMLPLGKGHSLDVSGFFFLQSGQVWTKAELVTILGGQAQVYVFLEPRGASRLPTQKELDLSLEWRFPIIKTLHGGLRVDAINVTNEQTLIGAEGLATTGVPLATSDNYQRPRYYRIMARLTF